MVIIRYRKETMTHNYYQSNPAPVFLGGQDTSKPRSQGAGKGVAISSHPSGTFFTGVAISSHPSGNFCGGSGNNRTLSLIGTIKKGVKKEKTLGKSIITAGRGGRTLRVAADGVVLDGRDLRSPGKEGN
jgi:hypothetical protein